MYLARNNTRYHTETAFQDSTAHKETLTYSVIKCISEAQYPHRFSDTEMTWRAIGWCGGLPANG